MEKQLLIVFVKNAALGKVKTRLASEIGEQRALDIYRELLTITEKACAATDADLRVYYSDTVESDGWSEATKFLQSGKNLGERMMNAFQKGFADGYRRIILIGSDLPEMEPSLLSDAFKSLAFMDTVIGPAEDGGYYLLGMRKMIPELFYDKPWSESHLLEKTLEELTRMKESYFLLKTLNDIDTHDDLRRSILG